MPQHEVLNLDQFDADGALAETGAQLDGDTRAAFLKKLGIGAAGLAGSSALLAGLPSIASAKGVPKSDVAILNFALTLEYLEATFYTQAATNLASSNYASFATLVRDDENAHVAALKKALGRAAVKKPTFDFGAAVTDEATFLKTSFVLENTGVAAYLGQAGKIKTPAILGAAASILTVEARHAAAIATLMNTNQLSGANGITPNGPFDKPQSKAAILKAVTATGFIKG
jgi:rubrerythrin